MLTAIFDIPSTADDAYIQGVSTSPTYPPTVTRFDSTETASQVLHSLITTSFFIRHQMQRFDTSSLPDDAVIASAIFRVNVAGASTVNSRSLTADWHTFSGYVTGATSDATSYSQTSLNNAYGGIAIGSITQNAQNDFTLLDPDTHINRSGLTGLRWHVTEGAPTAPTGQNQVGFNLTGSAFTPPQLIVTYTLNPVPPDGIVSSSGFSGSYTDAVTADANWIIGA